MKDIFVTVGLHENKPTFKVWYYDLAFVTDATKTPKCVHSRVLMSGASQLGDISCFTVQSTLTCAAIGFTTGQVLLLKGDITREKHSKIVQLHSSDYPVTNLNCFNEILYVTTVKDAQFYKLKEKSPSKIPLNAKGCAPNCAAISDQGELILGLVIYINLLKTRDLLQ